MDSSVRIRDSVVAAEIREIKKQGSIEINRDIFELDSEFVEINEL
jgi:hypothetical protein